ncbi:MAG: DUF4388 domain-containing protein [Acidobacteriota bacterium]
MSQTTYILLVDPDLFLQEMVESGFHLFNPEWTLLRAENPETAQLLLRRYDVSVVITEIEFPDARTRGVEFLLTLEDYSPHLPVVILTEAPAEDFQALVKASAFITKPPDMDYLLRKVNQLVQENKESMLRGISLESFLQVLEVEKKTCTLTLSAGDRRGRLYVHGGELIHAETEHFESKAAAFAMLSWQDYSIKIIEKCDAKPTITERLNAILMEWCVQKDHGLV